MKRYGFITEIGRAKRGRDQLERSGRHYLRACSPLQYLKRIRLDRARIFMVPDGYHAGEAARAVGYESAAQFSREFKRLFGVTPLEDAEQTRARLIVG